MARMPEMEARIAELEQRLRQMEAERARGSDLGNALSTIFPPEFRKHMRNSGREQLLALRALLDRWIEQTGEEPRPRRRESIKVE